MDEEGLLPRSEVAEDKDEELQLIKWYLWEKKKLKEVEKKKLKEVDEKKWKQFVAKAAKSSSKMRGCGKSRQRGGTSGSQTGSGAIDSSRRPMMTSGTRKSSWCWPG